MLMQREREREKGAIRERSMAVWSEQFSSFAHSTLLWSQTLTDPLCQK